MKSLLVKKHYIDSYNLHECFLFRVCINSISRGGLTDRIGYRKVLLFSFLTVGLFTIAMYFVNSFEMGLIVRLLAGHRLFKGKHESV